MEIGQDPDTDPEILWFPQSCRQKRKEREREERKGKEEAYVKVHDHEYTKYVCPSVP